MSSTSTSTGAVGKPRALIVHGYWSAPDRNWFPWLKGELERKGFDVVVPALPDSKHPDRAAWEARLARALPAGDVDGRTLIVAHSLGCYAVLHYLQRLAVPEPAAAVVLVSGFDRPLASQAPDLDLINAYVAPELDFDALRGKVRSYAVVSAVNDPIVPHRFSQVLARELGGRFVAVPAGGHFMGQEGCHELPVALRTAEDLLAAR